MNRVRKVGELMSTKIERSMGLRREKIGMKGVGIESDKKGEGEIDVTGNKRTEQVVERDASRYHGDKGEIIRGNHKGKS